MKSLVVIYKVPILVFKYCSSFEHYVVIDAAIYGRGCLKTKILFLINTGRNKFDYLELDSNGNERAHAVYSKVYTEQFGGQTQLVGSLFEQDDNQSKRSRASSESSASTELSFTLAHSDESGDDTSSNMSDNEHPKGDDSISDQSTAETSITSDESKKARKRDGFTFDPLLHTEVIRQPKYGLYSLTNTVIDSTGQVYRTGEPVKARGHGNPGRFLYGLSLWTSGGKSPNHVLYDPFEETFHHLAPSWVTAVEADKIRQITCELPVDYKFKFENNMTILLDTVSKKNTTKTMLRFPKISNKTYPSVTPVNKSTSDDASTGSEKRPVASAIAGRRSAGKGR